MARHEGSAPIHEPMETDMDSAQKRDRDRKQRQRRQDKEVRKKERAEQKILRRTTPELPATPEGAPSEPPMPEPRSTEG